MSTPKALSWCRFLMPVIALSMALGGSGLAQAQDDPGPVDSITVAATPAGRVPVLVELTEPAAAVAYGNALKENAALGPQRAQALAVSAGQLQIQRVGVEQDRFDAALADLSVKTQEIYRVRRAFNGVALQVDAGQMAALRRLPGVRAVYPIEPEYPTRSNSVPFLGTPKVWANTIGLPMGADGTGIRIGVIDTGIDYQHADFGGTGLLADYQANVRTVAPDAYFPSAKVVGGTDFAGDAYNGNNAPAPDPDPMDCTGHGSHVAGIAAGFGVNADGTTYAGPYTPSASFGAMRIQPGTAPKALLYAIRVFGCGGSTNLTVQGIDWAMDPNGDNDLSDHLDVINMSLGSPFGSLSQTSALASENAAAAGVIVVTSAGNSGDTYYITGAPGSATHAIATAASADDHRRLLAADQRRRGRRQHRPDRPRHLRLRRQGQERAERRRGGGDHRQLADRRLWRHGRRRSDDHHPLGDGDPG
jgi:subtilisin family serine protease